MKCKSFTMMLVAVLIGSVAFAAMDDKLYSLAYAPNGTTTASAVVRGELKGVYVDTQANNGSISGTLSITSMGVTIFSKAAIAADGFFRPMLLGHDSAGADIDWATDAGTTNRLYVCPPLAGSVTVTWVDGGSASNGTVNVRLIYAK